MMRSFASLGACLVLSLSGCSGRVVPDAKSIATAGDNGTKSTTAADGTSTRAEGQDTLNDAVSDDQTTGENSELIASNGNQRQSPDGRGTAESNTGAPELISFDDINLGMQPDSPFRPLLLQANPRANEIIGKRIIIGGYMSPPDSMTGVTEFILLRNLECKFGPGGQADHLVRVLMQGDASTDFTDKVVYVEGILALNPFPQDAPTTWSVFDLIGERVTSRPPPRR